MTSLASIDGVKTFTMSEEGFALFQKKLAKAVKKAVKNGATPIELTDIEFYEKLVDSGDGYKYSKGMVRFTLIGTKPVVKGYRVIASLENLKEDSKNIVRFMLGELEKDHDISKYYDSVACDHCGYNRRRKHTYIVQNEKTGEYMQIGKSCLEDYIEGDVSYLMALATINIADLEKEAEEKLKGTNSERGDIVFPIDQFLKAVLGKLKYRIVQGSGDSYYDNYDVTKATSTELTVILGRYKTATTMHIGDTMYKSLRMGWKNTEEIKAVSDAEVEDILKWVRGLNEEEEGISLSDKTYRNNIKTIVEFGYVKESVARMSASIVYAYLREKHKVLYNEALRQREEEKKNQVQVDYNGVKKPKINEGRPTKSTTLEHWLTPPKALRAENLENELKYEYPPREYYERGDYTLGQPGDAFVRYALVTNVSSFESPYGGTSYRITMVTQYREHLVWFTQANLRKAFVKHNTYEISGKLKKTQEYKGVLQNVITNVKLESSPKDLYRGE